jgi:hypothetical protein
MIGHAGSSRTAPSIVAPCLFVAAVLLVSCSAGSSAPAPNKGAAAPQSPAGASKHGPVVMGERFGVRVISDPQQGGMPVGVVSVPEKWNFDAKVVWNYANTSNPVTISSSTVNPANEEAVFGYPAWQFFNLRPVGALYRFGQSYGGLIYQATQPPIETLAAFIQRARAGAPNLQFVGSKDLPDLPAALKIPPSRNQHGIGVKITYELNGKPMEEEFYAVHYSIDIPYDGPQGRTWQINWGLIGLHSFRAPAGTLDRRRPVFATIAKSFRSNPAWDARVKAINAYLADQFNRQLQAGYDAIAAAGRLSRQISANNDAMIAGIDRQLQASRASGSSTETRSASDKFDDYIRGVETVDDPYYGTSQHSFNEQFHWTDGYGNYRNTNDASADPNRSEVGNWQLMRPVR